MKYVNMRSSNETWRCEELKPVIKVKSVERLHRTGAFGGGIRFLAGWLLLTALGLPLDAQPAADGTFRSRAQQLERAVYRRPRAGATFDLWYQHYAQANRQAELTARVEARRREAPQDANAQLVWGLVCERQADWQAAAAAFLAATELAPDDYYPHTRLAEVRLRAGQHNEAVESLSAALRLPVPRAERLSLARQLGQLHLRLGDRAAAIQLYADVADRFGDEPRVVSELATQLQQLGETQRAGRLWENVQRHARDAELQFQAKWELARLARENGDRQAALDQFAMLLDQVQLQSWRAVELSRAINELLVERDGADGPVEFWTQRWRDRPDDLAALLRATEALDSAHRLDDAIVLLQQAIERAPSRRDLRLRLVELLLQQGKIEQAIEQLRALLDQQPDDVELWLALGQYQLQQTDLSADDAQRQAIASWRRALQIRPDDADLALRTAETVRAAVESRSGLRADLPPTAEIPLEILNRNPLLWQACEAFYREAVRRDPSSNHLERLGEYLHRTRRQQAAIETWLSIGRDGSAGAWRDATAVLQRFGHLDAARQAAQAAIDIAPQALENWQLSLDVLIAQRDFSAALAAIERMRTMRTDDDDWHQYTWQMQATTIVASGAIDEHLESLQSRLRAHPNDSGTLWLVAQLKEAGGDRTSALELMARLVELTPNDTNIRRRYAAMLAADDQLSPAVAQYQQLVKHPPPHRRDDFQRLIDLQLRLGRTDDAAATVAQLLRQSPRDPEAYLLQAQVATARSQPNDKLAALQRAVQVAPRDEQALRQYAQALIDAGRADEALDVVTDLLSPNTAAPAAQRRATLAFILSWAATPEQRGRIEQHLRQLRLSDSTQAQDWTRLLAFWLEQTGRPDEALVELQTILARSPGDPLLLEQLVGLAELTRDRDQAVRFQERLVRLDPSSAPLEKLARLYRQAGRVEDAQAIWDQIVGQPGSGAEAIALIDQLLNRKDYFGAQRLAEASVSRFADDWRIIYRAGLLHLALEQYSAARETFESLLVQGPDPVPATEARSEPVDGLELMSLALAAKVEFSELSLSRQRLGARHARTLEYLSRRDLLEPGGRSSLVSTQVFGAVACLAALPEAMIDVNRLAELAQNSGGESARAVLAALWAGGHQEPAARLADWYRLENADDSLTHWLRLLTLAEHNSIDATAIEQLAASHDYLQQRHSADGRTLLRAYTHQLSHFGAHETARNHLQRQIAAAPQVGWLVELAALAQQVDPARRERLVAALLVRAGELAENADESRANMSVDIRQWLLQLAAWDDLPVDSRFDMIASWLPQAVLRAQLERQNEARPPRPAPTTRLGEFTNRLSQAVALNRQLGGRDEAQQRLLPVLQGDRSREVLDDGTVVVAARATAGVQPIIDGSNQSVFPVANQWLDGATLQTLRRVAEQCPEGDARGRLAGALADAAARLDSTPANRVSTRGRAVADRRDAAVALQLTQVILEWTWQQYDSALSRLETIHSEQPENFDVKRLLLRANLEQDRLDEAQRWMAELPDDDSEEIRYLESVLRERWTQRLHWQDLSGHAGAVSDLAVDPTGRWLASVGVDGTVRLWDVAAGRLQRVLHERGDILLAVAFSPDGRELAAAGYDRTIRRWQTEVGEPLPSLVGHEATVRTLDYAHDGRSLVSGADDAQLFVWNLATAQAVQRLEGHRGAVLSARFTTTSDGGGIASSGRDQTIRWWNVAPGSAVAAEPTPEGTVRTLTPLSESEGAGVLGAGDDRALRVWPRPRAAVATATAWPTIRVGASIGDFARQPDGPWVALGGDDRRVQVWDLTTARLRFTLAGHTGRVLAVTWSPDGRWLASSGFDGIIKLWRLDNVSR